MEKREKCILYKEIAMCKCTGTNGNGSEGSTIVYKENILAVVLLSLVAGHMSEWRIPIGCCWVWSKGEKFE